jgi:hypothetical protein
LLSSAFLAIQVQIGELKPDSVVQLPEAQCFRNNFVMSNHTMGEPETVSIVVKSLISDWKKLNKS